MIRVVLEDEIAREREFGEERGHRRVGLDRNGVTGEADGPVGMKRAENLGNGS